MSDTTIFCPLFSYKFQAFHVGDLKTFFKGFLYHIPSNFSKQGIYTFTSKGFGKTNNFIKILVENLRMCFTIPILVICKIEPWQFPNFIQSHSCLLALTGSRIQSRLCTHSDLSLHGTHRSSCLFFHVLALVSSEDE